MQATKEICGNPLVPLCRVHNELSCSGDVGALVNGVATCNSVPNSLACPVPAHDRHHVSQAELEDQALLHLKGTKKDNQHGPSLRASGQTTHLVWCEREVAFWTLRKPHEAEAFATTRRRQVADLLQLCWSHLMYIDSAGCQRRCIGTCERQG
jgi:hypothetical protein